MNAEPKSDDMAGVEVGSFDEPDETRTPDKTTSSTSSSEADLTAGDVYGIQPGHDAWALGEEPYVGEFDAALAVCDGWPGTRVPAAAPGQAES